jgi:seryl-tRNA synthetase
MLDLNYVRENLDLVARRLALRGPNAAAGLDRFRELDAERRRSLTEVETLRNRRNTASDEIARLKKNKQDASALIAEMKQVSDRIKELDERAKKLDADLHELLAGLPNVPHESAPAGSTPEDNPEVRRWGTRPEFSFPPKPHWELGEALGILDFERAAKIAGARFAVYWDLGAKLERALQNFMLDVHTRQNGYTEVLPPFIVNSGALFGTGQLPKFAGDLFKLEGHDFWLVPTAEVPLTNLFRGEVLDADQLPIKLAAFTPCFRSEAGSYGKDVRGLIRQHQFQKVELVKIAHPGQSYAELEGMTRDAESILQKLHLHYRVVELCAGDLGFASAKTYDIEVWVPGQEVFREISSCSNCEAFQARRANIRFRPAGGRKTELVHTLNGSGLAIGRTWLAILENYQQEDGSVAIPEALRPYLDGAELITPRGRLAAKS